MPTRNRVSGENRFQGKKRKGLHTCTRPIRESSRHFLVRAGDLCTCCIETALVHSRLTELCTADFLTIFHRFHWRCITRVCCVRVSIVLAHLC
jgi:hypothetical protein